MVSRTIDVGAKFMVDGLDPIHDGAGVPHYAIQTVDNAHGNAKVCVVYAERTTGVLTEVLRVDSMIGAPHITIRPDGSAYVCGGGKDNTIITGVSIPGFEPLLTTTTLAAALAALRLAVENMAGGTHQ
jgi:hypothetical protein